MTEINEGQIWWRKGREPKYGSWGGINIIQKLKDGRYYVYQYHEPGERKVFDEEWILEDYFLPNSDKL